MSLKTNSSKLYEESIVSSPMYRRIPEFKDKVDRDLIRRLIDQNAIEETIVITSEEAPKTGCCPKIIVKATADQYDS